MRTTTVLLLAGALLAPPHAIAIGPAVDGDGDGVADEVDRCPYTPPGIPVGRDGCSTAGDEDEDGVPEARDICPRTPPHARVDAHGCALDEDFDGVADGIDRCPHSPPDTPVGSDGCGTGESPAVAGAAPTRPAPPVVTREEALTAPAVTHAPVAAPRALPATAPAAAPPGVAAPAPLVRAPSESPAARVVGSPARVRFPRYSALLDDAAMHALDVAAEAAVSPLREDRAARLLIVGAARRDETGSAGQALGAGRAAIIRNYLLSIGLPALRVDVGAPAVGDESTVRLVR